MQISLRTMILAVLFIAALWPLVLDLDPYRLRHTMPGTPDDPLNITFSREGHFVFISNIAETAIFDAERGTKIAELLGSASSSSSISFDERFIVTFGNADEIVRIFRTSDGQMLLERKVLKPFIGGEIIGGAVFSPIRNEVFYGEKDGTYNLLDVLTGKKRHYQSHNTCIKGAVYASDGSRLFAVGDNGNIMIIDADTGEILRVLSSVKSSPSAWISVTGDGRWVATTDGLTIQLWDIKENRHRVLVSRGLKGLSCFGISPDGTILFVGYPLQIFDTMTGKEVESNPNIFFASYSPLGGAALGVSRFGTVQIFDMAFKKNLVDINDEARMGSIASDNQHIATLGRDGNVRIWVLNPRAMRGMVMLPEFWLTIIFGTAFLCLAVKDLKAYARRRRQAPSVGVKL